MSPQVSDGTSSRAAFHAAGKGEGNVDEELTRAEGVEQLAEQENTPWTMVCQPDFLISLSIFPGKYTSRMAITWMTRCCTTEMDALTAAKMWNRDTKMHSPTTIQLRIFAKPVFSGFAALACMIKPPSFM